MVLRNGNLLNEMKMQMNKGSRRNLDPNSEIRARRQWKSTEFAPLSFRVQLPAGAYNSFGNVTHWLEIVATTLALRQETRVPMSITQYSSLWFPVKLKRNQRCQTLLSSAIDSELESNA